MSNVCGRAYLPIEFQSDVLGHYFDEHKHCSKSPHPEAELCGPATSLEVERAGDKSSADGMSLECSICHNSAGRPCPRQSDLGFCGRSNREATLAQLTASGGEGEAQWFNGDPTSLCDACHHTLALHVGAESPGCSHVIGPVRCTCTRFVRDETIARVREVLSARWACEPAGDTPLSTVDISHVLTALDDARVRFVAAEEQHAKRVRAFEHEVAVVREDRRIRVLQVTDDLTEARRLLAEEKEGARVAEAAQDRFDEEAQRERARADAATRERDAARWLLQEVVSHAQDHRHAPCCVNCGFAQNFADHRPDVQVALAAAGGPNSGRTG